MSLLLPKGMREYYGRNIDTMPKILKAGETPMWTAKLLEKRLYHGDEYSDLWDYFDSSDLVVYPKGNDKEIYLLLTADNKGKISKNGRDALRLIKEGNLASNYLAIVKNLDELKGNNLIKIPLNDIIIGQGLTQEEILSEQLLRIVARHPDEVSSEFAGDKYLLQEYAKKVKSKTKKSKNMSIYLGESLKDKTSFGPLVVGELECGSQLRCWYGLGNSNGRFVGLAPEALKTDWKSIKK